MEVSARAKNVGASTKKLRLVVDSVRGMRVDDALDILRFTPTPLAKVVYKTVQSAVANAENNFQMSRDALKIVRIHADDGPMLRRYRPRPRGRVAPIRRRFSHLTVVVDEEEEEE
ncbi:MAG: 50S ribosomal protein L22 [Dehalococcoidia bacterium]